MTKIAIRPKYMSHLSYIAIISHC